jgi:hypothetical protein
MLLVIINGSAAILVVLVAWPVEEPPTAHRTTQTDRALKADWNSRSQPSWGLMQVML